MPGSSIIARNLFQHSTFLATTTTTSIFRRLPYFLSGIQQLVIIVYSLQDSGKVMCRLELISSDKLVMYVTLLLHNDTRWIVSGVVTRCMYASYSSLSVYQDFLLTTPSVLCCDFNELMSQNIFCSPVHAYN